MSQALYVASQGGVFKFRRSRGADKAWRVAATAFASHNASAIKHEPETDTTFVALNHGPPGVSIHRTANGWSRWQECATPAYPADSNRAVKADLNKPSAVPTITQLVWVFATSRNGWRLWCGTIPGGLFMSNDAGDSWILAESLWRRDERKAWFGCGYDFPGIHSICIDPSNEDHVLVGISGGGIWVSHDAANSWTHHTPRASPQTHPKHPPTNVNIQDPHRVVQCKASPEYYWAQLHNGVVRSTDHGKTWTAVTPVSSTSIACAIAVHPHDPLTAWIVHGTRNDNRTPTGAALMVARTTDGGETFDVETDVPAHDSGSDLIHRHAIDVNDDGDTVAFGTAKGSLWLSDDAGAHWRPIARDLPPIHAVQFA